MKVGRVIEVVVPSTFENLSNVVAAPEHMSGFFANSVVFVLIHYNKFYFLRVTVWTSLLDSKMNEPSIQ